MYVKYLKSTEMSHNDENFYFLSQIFHSDSENKPVMKEQGRFTAIELPHRIISRFTQPLRNQTSSQSKWLEQDKKNYLKFYLNQFIKRPYLCLSWKHWKPDQTLPRMAQYIKTKDMKQCKSYDERMKQQNFDKRSIDIIDYVKTEIKQYQNIDKEINFMLSLFQELRRGKKSKHMEIISQINRNFENINEKTNRLLKLLKI